MTKSVAHIFGGEGKVKIMRLFIFNKGQTFTSSQVSKKAKVSPAVAAREIRNLFKAGLIRRKGKSFALDSAYAYRPAIENFLVDAAPITEKDIVKSLSRCGSIKLILISGVFLRDKDARVDMLVVGDNLKHRSIVSAISRMEAEIGKEIRYAVFETSDFNYRRGIYDKLIRDILEYNHQKILNKLGLE